MTLGVLQGGDQSSLGDGAEGLQTQLWLPQMFTQDDGMNISMEEEEGRRRALTRGGVACGVEGSQPSPA